MPKRTRSGVRLAGQASTAMVVYQNTPYGQHGAQLAVQVQGLQQPPHAPPIAALVLGTPGSSQQEPSQQGSSGVSSGTGIVFAGVANAAGPSSSGQAQEGQDAGRIAELVEDNGSPMSEESGMTSIRTEPAEELPESSTGSVPPVRGPAEGM